uniref:Uncharacterized protein n=1 Tax=uncultured bacterium Contig1777_n_1791_cl TaxID=1393515 RepID=W0FTI0_9BACT|nr:hypothetical protein [uncultured bacterium Contig1777_n_1791_cl]
MDSSTMSSMTCSRRVSLIMAFPPYFTATIRPL